MRDHRVSLDSPFDRIAFFLAGLRSQIHDRGAESFRIELVAEIHSVFEERDIEEVRVLAAKIVQREPSVALLATKEAGAARLVFARSPSLAQNMGELLAEACQALGGRGGGKAELAQGGGPDIQRVEEIIRAAAETLEAH